MKSFTFQNFIFNISIFNHFIIEELGFTGVTIWNYFMWHFIRVEFSIRSRWIEKKNKASKKQNFRKMELRALISSHYKNLRIIFFSSNFGGLARNLDLLLFSPDASLWINLGITVLQTNNDPLIEKDDETFILTSLV